MKTLFLLAVILFSASGYSICDGTRETISFNDPVNKTTFNIQARIYRPATAKFPVVFILPPIIGETPLDGALAVNFCLNGMGSYVLNVLNDPSDSEQVSNLNVHEDALIRSEFALTKWIEKLKMDPAISGNFGIVGASQGGIISTWLAGTFSDIKASVLLAASGNVAQVLATSTQSSIASLRDKRKEFFNLETNSSYENLMRPFITRDPLIVAENIPSGSSLVYVMLLDTDVPTKNQRELVRALKNPEVVEINNSHIPGIVEAATLRSQTIVDFLKSKLFP